LTDDLVGSMAGSGSVDPHALCVWRSALMPERSVLPQREREHQAVLLSILGDVADPRVAPLACRQTGDRSAVELDLAGGCGELHDRFDQFLLAVSFHPGNPDDLPGVDVERHVVDDI